MQQPDESLHDYIPDESLHDYIKRYFANRNTITEVDDRDVFHYFNEGLHNIELWSKMWVTI